MLQSSKIYVAGHTGLVGSSLVRRLKIGRAQSPDFNPGRFKRTRGI